MPRRLQALAYVTWGLFCALGTFGCGLALTNDLTRSGSLSQADGGDVTGSEDGRPSPLDGKSVRLTGSLGAGAVQRDASQQPRLRSALQVAELSFAVRALWVSCSTLSAPASVGTAKVDGSGNFAVVVEGAQDVLLSCSLLGDGNALLANFVFQGGGTSIDGNARMAHEVALHTDVDFGRVYWDDSTFEVAVNADSLKTSRSNTLVSPKSLADIAGAYTVVALDTTDLGGTSPACAAGAPGCTANLQAGNVLLVRSFTGTQLNGGGNVTSLQIWDSGAQATTCGNKVGLSSSAQAAANLSFAAQNAASTDFFVSNSVTWNNAVNGGVQTTSSVNAGLRLVDAAINLNDVPACEPTSFTTSAHGSVQGLLCGPDSNGIYRATAGLGCTDLLTGTASPLLPQPGDWAAAQAAGQCNASPDGVGLTALQCTLTPTSSIRQLQCTSVGGDFTAPGVPAMAPAAFSAATPPLAAAGSLCSSMDASSPAHALLQTACYASFLPASGAPDADGACLPQQTLDATNLDAAHQLSQNFRPKHLRHQDLLQARADGSGGTVSTRITQMATAWAAEPTFGNTPIACKVITTRSFSYQTISPTRLRVVWSEQTGTDDTRPACLANFALGAQRTVAWLDKR